MTNKIGLHFKKLDLHVHTPASDDYKQKTATPKQIVDVALATGLSAIAVTDHQTGDWVDAIKTAAEGTGLIIFPGAEIMVNGGEEGIHIICLFDRDKNSEHIKQFLNRLEIYNKSGQKTLCTELSVGKVADKLLDYDKNALLILSHSHSSKGALGDIKGEVRSKIFEQPRPSLIGAEASDANFQDNEKQKQHKRVIDILDGADPNYHNRKCGVYQSSDAHDLSGIGCNYSFFKVDDDISIEDIRQCLIDRETRIRQPFEFHEGCYPAVLKMKITSGILDGQEFYFNQGLNSILGAKGSGKSLAMEFLRFVLNQPPKNPGLAEDHKQKLEKCLKTYGKVEIEIQDDSGKRFIITREYKPNDGNPIKIIDSDDQIEKQFEVEYAFPILFLSQNEVIKIAEDITGREPRQFIDKFFDFQKFQQDLSRSNQELLDADRRFAESLRSQIKLKEIEKQKQTLQAELERINRQLTNKAFTEYQGKEFIGKALRNQHAYLQSLKQQYAIFKEQLTDFTAPPEEDATVASDPSVKRSFDISSQTHKESLKKIDEAIAQVQAGILKLEHEIKGFEAGFLPIKQEYEKLVKEAGGNQIVLSEKRKRTVAQIEKMDKEIVGLKGKASQLKAIDDRRKQIIDAMEQIRKEYFAARKKRCDYFTSSSGGALQVHLLENKDTSEFAYNLMKFKRGSWFKDEEINLIASTVTPYDFAKGIFHYEYKGRQRGQWTKSISDKTKIDEDKISKLYDHLLGTLSYEEILALQYGSMPDDKPSISYKVGSEYKPLSDLSIGQKSVTLLIMALSEGTFPIVIDQPEDSLDLRTIWDDVCQKVRGAKDMRQFIFTTHNSSVAVASDSDNFSVLESDAARGKVVFSGSMNKPTIRDQVIKYLEGGEPTYRHKRRKYNI
jgi:hypothetical protein